jgi:hypothetical protein
MVVVLAALVGCAAWYGQREDRQRKADADVRQEEARCSRLPTSAGPTTIRWVEGESEPKEKVTLYFREALLEEARSAVLALSAEGLQPSNLSQLFVAALEHEIERLREAHNAGEPFPPYEPRLPGGRPHGGAE